MINSYILKKKISNSNTVVKDSGSLRTMFLFLRSYNKMNIPPKINPVIIMSVRPVIFKLSCELMICSDTQKKSQNYCTSYIIIA